MASVVVTREWSDPTGSLTDGASFVVQNKSTGVVTFFEGSSFDASTNDGDGLLLVPLHDNGSGNSDMRWTYTAANEVRVRLSGGIDGVTNVIEFAPAA